MKTLSSLTAPRQIVRKVLERDVQNQCVCWMRTRGYWARKFSSQSQRSVPDYLFAHDSDFVYQAIKFATEFKAPGKTSTAAQIDEQEAMRKVGWFVFECDDFERFKQVVQEYESWFKFG